MTNISTNNRFQIINGRTYLDGKLVTVTSEPLQPVYANKIQNLNLTITSRGTAIKLMKAMEKTWQGETFAVLPAGNEWQLINARLLSQSDLAWLDEARSLPEYYEVA
jgi:hypothetical protein